MTDWIANGEAGSSVRTKLNTLHGTDGASGGAGGPASLIAGAGNGAGVGGAVTITAGAGGATDANGGDITVTPGAAGGIGTAGHFKMILANFADDTAAAAGGVPVNGWYRTASVVKVRVA